MRRFSTGPCCPPQIRSNQIVEAGRTSSDDSNTMKAQDYVGLGTFPTGQQFIEVDAGVRAVHAISIAAINEHLSVSTKVQRRGNRTARTGISTGEVRIQLHRNANGLY